MPWAWHCTCRRESSSEWRPNNRDVLMTDSLGEALDAVRQLGTIEQMRASAAEGVAPAQRPAVNSHVHLPPNFSAFESVEQVLDLAAEQNVGVLGVSNYYDFGIYADFVALARRRGIFPLFGLEVITLIDELVRSGVLVNDPNNPGRAYLCGKGITRFVEMSAEAARLMGVIRDSDRSRMAEMTAKVGAIFERAGVATGLDADAIVDSVVARHGCPPEAVTIQERHIAQAFQEAVFAVVPTDKRQEALAGILGAQPKDAADVVKVQGDIRTHLMKSGKPAFVPESFLCFADGYRLILELGGIPCYPTLADGASPICEYEQPVEKLIDNLRSLNVHCVELIPIRNEPDVLSHYVKTMRAAGLVVTAGTEHNTLDLLDIEPTCISRQPVPDDLKEIFFEGACVVAAHQFLTLHGECGFVDSDGRTNDRYATAQERIEGFASLGAAVIESYYRANRT